jgi:hypothetical protein
LCSFVQIGNRLPYRFESVTAQQPTLPLYAGMAIMGFWVIGFFSEKYLNFAEHGTPWKKPKNPAWVFEFLTSPDYMGCPE